ncbi:MAG: iron-containing alcohol dehydrogenase [Fuerstiella sp.]|nr:iron-containing alcohol dehydrogenase [Fuerstiella sp.]
MTHSSHGAGNGLLLPHVMRFNLSARQSQTARIAQLLGCDVSGMTEEEMAEHAITTVQQLASSIGIPRQLRELGMNADQIPTVAEKTLFAWRILRVNPREVSRQDVEEILRAAQ